MSKFVCTIVLFMNMYLCIAAEDLLDEIIRKSKDEKHEKTHKDLEQIVPYIKEKKQLEEEDLDKIKEVIQIYYESRKTVSYLPPVLQIAHALKKDQLRIIRPLMKKIIEDPNQRTEGGRTIMYQLDYIFDDRDGALLLKYKDNFDDNLMLLGCLLNENFNKLKYNTFRAFFITILDGDEKSAKEFLYCTLKSKLLFIDCFGEKKFQESSEEEKAVEYNKMKNWLAKTTDLDVANEKFCSEFILKISQLTKDNFKDEIFNLDKNYPIFRLMPGVNGLMLDPFDEKDKGFPMGLKIVVDEMQSWVLLHKGSFSHYSVFEWDLLIRSIAKKIAEKQQPNLAGEARKLEMFKKLMIAFKEAIEKKSAFGPSDGRHLDRLLKEAIEKSQSEKYKEICRAMSKEIHTICPEAAIPRKRGGETRVTDDEENK